MTLQKDVIPKEEHTSRIYYFDILRIVAIIAVMALHIAGQNWRSTDVYTPEWTIFNIADSVTRWGVPVFVMISGALFLGGKQSIGHIYKKNISRIVVSLLAWSAVYMIVDAYNNGIDANRMIEEFAFGHFHLWFLYMIIGLYMIVPVIRPMVASQTLVKYFLTLAFFVTFLIPEIVKILQLKYDFASSILSGLLSHMSFSVPVGYIGYFVLGYFLNQIRISLKLELTIYILGVCGFLFTIFATGFVSHHMGEAYDAFYYNMTCNVLFEGSAVFVFAKQRLSKICGNIRIRKIVLTLSSWSFGAYLVHALVLEVLDRRFMLNTMTYHPAVSVPVLLILVGVISFAVSALLNCIPVLKKWIV